MHLLVVVAFPDAKPLRGRIPAQLVDCRVISIASTNVVIYASSASILFETIPLHSPVSVGKKRIQKKHYVSGSDMAEVFFLPVNLRCNKPVSVTIMKLIVQIML